ncbi:ATP-dependent helicase [Stenomitos frigidus]|uniref:DNA 3'-5' helicase n=1 Tax=Stenomitos frigidus ULC18 TaxID=2107698 RepID=A0A2T1ER63_9CYAN|nr:ATP-dependent helicase [Stenomitos frigidus]PSB35229.1 DNA helicase UvrD [Stenomitos frigidus ULC18]
MPVESPAHVSLEQLRDRLRPGQRELALWQGGPLAVSAVPGAGKSTGMAVAAAIAIAQHQLNTRRQLVVVTFTRSAAANIKTKIRQNLKALGLPPGGFVVQTLHGLAWTIARAHPELSGLNQDSVLVTPNQNHRLIRTCVEQWISANARHYQTLLEGRQFDGEETERLRRQSVLRTEVLPALATTVIHEAKSSGLLPDDLRSQSNEVDDPYTVLTIAAGLYEFYQTQLRFRNLIDYDEMILAALRVLEDPAVRQSWQQQVFAVFEDEAQDSSPLQTRLLELLAADPADPMNRDRYNLVRVGDPNQAINSTFTPADPIFFREFCEECRTQNRLATMTQAGRSSRPIIEAANFVLQWVNKSRLAGVEQPFRVQAICPVDRDDPQPNANPVPEGQGLELHTPDDVYQTVERIGQRALQLFKQHPQGQAAVLVRTNDQGRFVAKELHRWYGDKLLVYEVGQRDRQSHVPVEMLTLLNFLDRPHSPDHLKAALTVLVARKRIPTQDLNALVGFPEQFLYPGPLDPLQPEPVIEARHYCNSLLNARLKLPPAQLIPFLALTLDYEQTELATADKLTERIAQQLASNQTLAAILGSLNEIVASEQFEPVDADDAEERYTRLGQLTVITMHKAKGLDWDYVFIPFLHEQTIPGSQWIPPQGQFLGDFTLAEVARAQIRASLHNQFPLPSIDAAWERAKNLKTAEEFRLLYVAMTRAKRLLWLSAARKAPFTWNKPENLQDREPCPALPALMERFPTSVMA